MPHQFPINDYTQHCLSKLIKRAPFQGCACAPLDSWPRMLTHLNNVHQRGLPSLDPPTLNSLAAWFCMSCAHLNGHGRPCPGNACSHLEPTERKLRAQRASRGEPLPPIDHNTHPVEGPSQRPTTPLDQPRPDTLPSPESILQLRTPVLRHVPRGCRTQCADALAKVIARLLDHPTWESFLRFLLFPKFVLRAPRHGARKDNRGMPTWSYRPLSETESSCR